MKISSQFFWWLVLYMSMTMFFCLHYVASVVMPKMHSNDFLSHSATYSMFSLEHTRWIISPAWPIQYVPPLSWFPYILIISCDVDVMCLQWLLGKYESVCIRQESFKNMSLFITYASPRLVYNFRPCESTLVLQVQQQPVSDSTLRARSFNCSLSNLIMSKITILIYS